MPDVINSYQTSMIHLYKYGAILSLSTFIFWVRSKRNKRCGPLPPSPKADPLIGNLRTLMGIVDEPKTYRNWGTELGSMRDNSCVCRTMFD
jgi:hypothetical protein